MVRPALLTLLLASATAFGQVSVPPDVESVESGGYWESGGAAGRYRIVVLNSGYEVVTSRLYVQWIRDPRISSRESEVVASVEPVLPFGPGVASFRIRLAPEGTGRARVFVEGVMSREPQRKVKAVLIAAQPGKVAP